VGARGRKLEAIHPGGQEEAGHPANLMLPLKPMKCWRGIKKEKGLAPDNGPSPTFHIRGEKIAKKKRQDRNSPRALRKREEKKKIQPHALQRPPLGIAGGHKGSKNARAVKTPVLKNIKDHSKKEGGQRGSGEPTLKEKANQQKGSLPICPPEGAKRERDAAVRWRLCSALSQKWKKGKSIGRKGNINTGAEMRKKIRKKTKDGQLFLKEGGDGKRCAEVPEGPNRNRPKTFIPLIFSFQATKSSGNPKCPEGGRTKKKRKRKNLVRKTKPGGKRDLSVRKKAGGAETAGEKGKPSNLMRNLVFGSRRVNQKEKGGNEKKSQ